MTSETKRMSLKQRLEQPGLIVAPGVFDMISARIADRMGFDVLYMTGYGVVASYLGVPTPDWRPTPTWSAGRGPSPRARRHR